MAYTAHQIKQTISCKYQNILWELFVCIMPFLVSKDLQFNIYIYIYIVGARANWKLLDINATCSYILRNCIIIHGILLQIVKSLEMRNTCNLHFSGTLSATLTFKKLKNMMPIFLLLVVMFYSCHVLNIVIWVFDVIAFCRKRLIKFCSSSWQK